MSAPASSSHDRAPAGPQPQLASPQAPSERPAVDPEYAQACAASETCADGRACVDGMCAPCIADDECEGELLCARSRCVVPEDVSCTHDEDCGVDGYCVDDVRAHGPARARHFTVCTDEAQGDLDPLLAPGPLGLR